MTFDYSSIRELINRIEENDSLKVVDGWRENRNYVLEIRHLHRIETKTTSWGVNYKSVRLKISMSDLEI